MSKRELVVALENIAEWAESRDGSPEADDKALRTISDICTRFLKACGVGEGK